MGYTIYKFQNASGWPGNKEPSIFIDENDPGWKEALKKWKDGQNPTDSKLWKKEVFALTRTKTNRD